MNKLFSFFITTVCICLSSTNGYANDTLKHYNNNSLLWEISGKDMKRPSYLFGTIHLVCKQDYIWTPIMQKALKSSKEVCFEMNMGDPSLMMKIAMGMIDNSGKTLKDYFNKNDYNLIEKFVKDSLGMSLDMFQQMKPAVLLSLFTTNIVSCKNPVSYETNILDAAQKLKLQTSGLEEPEEQISLFNSLQTDSIVKELLEMINNFSAERKDYSKMIAEYRHQNLPQLYKIIEETKQEGGDTKTFLDDRNKKWIERMEEKMDQQSVFFAVGAGHLWGENGLINLLRIEGYTVAPLK